jgi:predicted dinucleotide-binding enzyme
MVQGKIVVDAMNPYNLEGGLYDLGDSTSSEEVQKRLPGARLVKAFNTMYFERLAHEGRTDLPLPKRLAMFVAGDDAEAKKVVMHLIEQIGFDPVDTGSLREGGRRQQPGSPIYNVPITGEQARQRLKAA